MDLVLGLDLYFPDRAGDGRLHRDLHLHRLEDDQRVALGDALTRLDVHLPDVRGDLGMDFGHVGDTSEVGTIISIIISGLIVGALGRLAIPGPNPMSIPMTILVGIGGALVGGLIGSAITDSIGLIVILEVLAAAGIVYLMQRRNVGAGTRRDGF